MVSAVKKSNRAVYQQAQQNSQLTGMGTTFTCLVRCGLRIYIGHVGDSRAYLLRGNTFTQLTKDHSLVTEMVRQGKITTAEAKVHPDRNIITRAVGSQEEIEVDACIEQIEENDMVLLCSDGLTNMVPEENIKQILLSDCSLEQKADWLIASAKEKGGIDNISVIVLGLEVKQ